jgi:hypothetical protein
MTASHLSRTGRVASAFVVGLALLVAGCGTSRGVPTYDNGVGCENWCGNGSARVSVGGATVTINDGGCFDTGAGGIDARFGDWSEIGVGDYLTVGGYRSGDPTPTAGATAAAASPAPTVYPSVSVSGSVNGMTFVLDTSARVDFAADGTGTFSGTDLNGAGSVSGSFSCS